MRTPPALLPALALGLAACGGPAPAPSNGVSEMQRFASGEVTLAAADGVKIRGREMVATSPKAVILLFHQAGSSSGEYAPIMRPLAEAGYSSLAIDQRSGGDMYGPNLTVHALGGERDYLSARQDLEAALAWARTKKLPVILWGSSYSAALVFLVAAEHPGEVAAVLAFSPDEYLDSEPGAVHAAAAKLAIPVFVTSAQDAKEVAAARSLLDAVPAKTKVQFVPVKGGVHGSSTLRADRNAGGAPAVWGAVLGFLGRAAP